MRSSQALILATGALSACQTHPARQAPDAAVTPNVAAARDTRATEPAATVVSTQPPSLLEPAATTEPLTLATPSECAAADWSARKLPPLLRPGKKATPSELDRAGSAQLVFDAECTDAPAGAAPGSPAPVVDGVELRLASVTPAGSSGRGWSGNQCAFDVRLADGAGKTARLGPERVPPFTTISALVRSGSAVWLSLSFNGYTREFPRGGNRIVALDLCEGRVVWQSKDATSNGGLLLLGDYLLSPFGFTSERRFVFVLDARSGSVVQKLGVVENICPSKSWAPHWHAGERCDAPGQAVGAATNPRVEGGVFLVDTNTGSASFQFH
jgi:hypothetical protein